MEIKLNKNEQWRLNKLLEAIQRESEKEESDSIILMNLVKSVEFIIVDKENDK